MPDDQLDPANPSLSKDAIQSAIRPLALLAREALEDKHRKKCLALTNAMLKMDPESKEAQVIQSWVLSDIERDLEHARSLVRNSRLNKNPSICERAEVILKSILDATPENQEAQALMVEVQDALRAPVPTVPSSEPEAAGYFAPRPASLTNPMDLRPGGILAPRRRWTGPILLAVLALVVVGGVFLFTRTPESLEMSSLGNAASIPTAMGTLEMTVDDGVDVFIDDRYAGKAPLPPLRLKTGVYHLRYELNGEDLGEEEVTISAEQSTRNSQKALLGSVSLVVVPSTGVYLKVDGKPPVPLPPALRLLSGQRVLEFAAAGYLPQTVPTSVVAGETVTVTTILKPAQLPGSPVESLTDSLTDSRTAENSTTGSGSPSGSPAYGTLAVSSAVPVEIYSEGRLVGSTPTTLELAPGTHTLEYRYQDLRQTLSHVITRNQTTTASVAFDVTVQINARPWAQVFVEGIQPKLLGQTPLSDVRVPIGSILVFRNPGFPEKKYRVSGSDGAIQVVFP